MEQLTNHPLYKVHTIDSAMNSLWSFYKKNFLVLFVISFIMGLAVQLLSSGINMAELQSVTEPEEMLNKIREFIWPIVFVSLASILSSVILQYYIIYKPLNSDYNIFGSILASLRYFIPFLIIMILLAIVGSFALFLGLLVLIIGVFFAAIYLLMIYLFILPVLLVEGPGIATTIDRTSRLAHRNFWSNIGWTAVFIILILIISIILSGVVLLPFTGSFLKAFTSPEEAMSLVDITTKPLYIILSALVNALTLPLMPIFAAILYFNALAREQGYDQQVSSQTEEQRVRVEDLYAKPLPENDQDGQTNQ